MRMSAAFARRFRGVLLRQRMDPADVARRMGGAADAANISNWLAGRNEPSMRNLLRLSVALRISPLELISNKDDNGNPTDR